jgi:2-haloacid dehalogenase
MPRYQWLFFDADGTLFDYDRAEVTALEQAFQRIGAPFDSGFLTKYRRINQELWQALEKGLITPEALKVRRFELLFKATGLINSPTDFSAVYLDCLANCSELIDGASDVLGVLHQKHQVAILTNGLQHVQRNRLARSAIRDHISEIIISEEIGVAKPAKEFFDTAFAQSGNPSKREVLMIGDSWISDMQGASVYGVDTCWFNPQRQSRPDKLEITREIASLHELIDWLQ